MKLTCLFGHTWNGCKCEKCGKTRDENHDWNGCKCRICGKTRDEHHDWNGCICRTCGKTRDKQHDFKYKNSCGKCMGICRRCGKEEFTTHDYRPVLHQCYQVCSRCGDKTRPEHDFREVPGKCVSVCAVCGAEDSAHAAHHTFVPAAGKCVRVCAVCGAEEDAYKAKHTWEPVEGKCEETCAVCGATKPVSHQYANGECVRCKRSIDEPGPNGIPPLLQAAFDGNVETVRKLIAGGANLNLCTPDETPLMAAARKGYDEEHKEIVRILLDAGANINKTDQYGSSALRLAQRQGLGDMVNYLASRGGRYLGA